MKEWKELVDAAKSKGVMHLYITSNNISTKVRYHGQTFILFERPIYYGVNLLVSACKNIAQPAISLDIESEVIIDGNDGAIRSYLGALVSIVIRPLYNEFDQKHGVFMMLKIVKFDDPAK